MRSQVFLNEKDIWLEYGANLIKGAYSTLLGSLQAKDVVSNTSRLEDGDRVVVNKEDSLKFKSREFTIQIVFEGSSRDDVITKFNAFITEAAHGYSELNIPKLVAIFTIVLREVSEIKDYNAASNKWLRTAKFKFLEPNPMDRG